VEESKTSEESVEESSNLSEDSSMENVNTFQNPSFSEPTADPFVVYHDGYYYSLRTGGFWLDLHRSRSVDSLFTEEKKNIHTTAFAYLAPEYQGMEIPSHALEHDIHSDIWAPEIHYNPKTERWYIYASGAGKSWEFSTIRMFCYESATSDPWSDYTYKGIIEPDVLSIDPTIFYDEKSENLYIAFSEFTSDKGQVITLALMENPWTISDKRVQVSYPKYNWEKLGEVPDKDSRVNEGPVFTYKNGKLCLIYSASGCWSQYYRLGIVEYVGEDFSVENMLDLKNWEKKSIPIFKAANNVYGVGHCSFFSSPDGTETWIAYHGMSTPDAGEAGRYLYLQKIDFDENGVPVLGRPLSRDTKIPYPSGDPDA
jgi:GH43 family beta-xylosidase